jgi:hypothetical protein
MEKTKAIILLAKVNSLKNSHWNNSKQLHRKKLNKSATFTQPNKKKNM